MSMSDRIAGALVGAVAAVGVLGAGWAWAQEAPTTTTPPTTEAPSDDGATDPAPDDRRHGRNCDKDGDGQPDGPPANTATEL